MKRLSALFLLLFICFTVPAAAQADLLADRIETALRTRDKDAYLALVAPQEQATEKAFIDDFFSFDYKNLVFRLAESDGNKLLFQMFLEAGNEARSEVWVVETETRDGQRLMKERKSVSSITGLYQLRMSRQAFPATNLEIRHHDAIFHLKDGDLFPIYAAGEMAGVVFIGEGAFEFAPRDPPERQQLKLFCKAEKLATPVKHFYFRGDAVKIQEFFGDKFNTSGSMKEKLQARALKIEKDSDYSIYGVMLPLAKDLWFPRLQRGELYFEMETANGTLIYQFYPGQSDDILLAQKDKNRIISLYSSRGRHAVQQAQDFLVGSYKLRVNFNPSSLVLSSTTDVTLRSTEPTTSLVFDLNPELRVSHIRSSQGTLMYFQERKGNNLHVVLNKPLAKGQDLLLQFQYQGRVEPDKGRQEGLPVETHQKGDFYIAPSYLYSSQSVWYPQLESRPYARMEAVISVPDRYAAVSNGKLITKEKSDGRTIFTYRCDVPIKYFALFVHQLSGTLFHNSAVPVNIIYHAIDRSGAEEVLRDTDGILQFYVGLYGAYPYADLNVILRPLDEPGGHAPATIAVVNRIFASYFEKKFVRDPVYITEFPDFLLAHEIAHQWWGQSVGWLGYRDQWLSEGFAQYAAAQYIRHKHGNDGWIKLSRIFQKWIEEKTEAGPVILGSRIGHLIEDPRAYSAILYNKGAYILNMLRIWMGDESFRKCLAEFHAANHFKRVTIADFRSFAQEYTDDDLQPFFDQWLYRWDIPAVTWKQVPTASGARLRFSQPEEGFYVLKIPVSMKGPNGEEFHALIMLDEAVEEIDVPAPFIPSEILIDPLRENLVAYKTN